MIYRHLGFEIDLHTGGRTTAKRSWPDVAPAMRADFEAHMEDDLDVAGAFDALIARLYEAAAAARGDGLSPRRRKAVGDTLRRIDKVLGVFGGDVV
jgi:hypothetical protein